MSFLPDNYQIPVDSNYMRLEKGKNKFRILSSAITGYEWWEDVENGRKPFRVKTANEAVAQGQEPIKHFWAFVVWNYQVSKVQILEVTQKTVMTSIRALTRDEDWGDPKDYDINVTREGDGLNTEYSVLPGQKKPVDEAILAEFEELSINLEALFDGTDPFAQGATK